MVPFINGQLYDFCPMYSRNLFVLDFARRFFVSCTQISEAYVDEIRVQLAENRPESEAHEVLRDGINFH